MAVSEARVGARSDLEDDWEVDVGLRSDDHILSRVIAEGGRLAKYKIVSDSEPKLESDLVRKLLAVVRLVHDTTLRAVVLLANARLLKRLFLSAWVILAAFRR